MAVRKIKAVNIIGRMSDLEQATEACGRSGVFHPDNALSFYSDTSHFTPISDDNPYAEPLQRISETIRAARKPLRLLGREKTCALRMEDRELFGYVDRFSAALSELQAERVRAQQEIQKDTQELEKISHFTEQDLDLEAILACKLIKVRFGALPKESYDKLNLYDENPYVVFFPCSRSATHYYGVYFAPIEQVSEVDRIFSSLYFERIRIPNLAKTPQAAAEELRAQRAREIEAIKAADQKIAAFWEKEKETAWAVYSRLLEKSTYFGIRRYAACYNDNFILTGWVPADEADAFAKEMEPLQTVECTFDRAENEMMHSPPVQLKNRKPFRPFEFFVDMYGLPSYDEIDPTPFVAVTYIVLFGIMFADLGQGLLVSLVGALMWKLRKMPLGRILIPCGVSSALFGTLFGSVFGFEHALDPLFTQVFGLPGKPIEVMEPEMTNVIIYAAVGIGLALVVVAMLINIYSSLRRKHYENALFGPNGVAGLVFYCAVVVGFGGQLFLGWQIISVPYVVCLVAVPLLLVFFREVLGGLVERRPNWKPESWGEFLVQNFFEVFEYLLSYASNTMSFLRVGAFVLVHAGMMMVVFTLADMGSGLAYVLVVVIGNVFVTALEGLLVGIQVLRLEFYEMFSRFFDGEGRPFRPVTVRQEEEPLPAR